MRCLHSRLICGVPRLHRCFVSQALALGHKVVVVVNKIDRPASRPEYVVDTTFDLFCELNASDEQLDFQ
eukprot:50610-Eustigmatos_ZCMA.PRE.1